MEDSTVLAALLVQELMDSQVLNTWSMSALGMLGESRRRIHGGGFAEALQGEEVCSLFSVFEKWPREVKLPGA